MAFADGFLVPAARVQSSEQQTERVRLFLLLDLRLAQDLQERNNASALQELIQILITEESEEVLIG